MFYKHIMPCEFHKVINKMRECLNSKVSLKLIQSRFGILAT